jgi:predicted O-linked N-acetylglucosamine transferase (SPINDLY family)
VRDVRELSEREIAGLVREDGIEILVNVSWEARMEHLRVFADRAAPVQIELPHYPATTGLTETDYILTDQWICPDGCEGMYTERVRRLPHSYMPWRPPTEAPPVAVLPAVSNGFVTFGLFQKPAKIHSSMWDAIAEILKRTPGSRLLVHQNSRDLDDTHSAGRRLLTLRAKERGIEPDRLVFAGMRDHQAHLEVVGSCDIALDSFPYSGTTTTGDCLWMGVPVVTLAGDTHAGRVSYSQLSRVGLQEWVAESREAYVEIAVGLAGNVTVLGAIRSGLRARVQSSRLIDERAVMEGIEREYRAIWKEQEKTQ